LYDLGQRDFGENYVQELMEKKAALPADIRWHFIGHLQSNKAKLIIPFVHLIQGVDSIKLLKEINKQAERIARKADVLLQVHIAEEETKFGFDEKELNEVQDQLTASPFPWVNVQGLMGMASLSSDEQKIRMEFRHLKKIFDQMPNMSILSMGMSSDYRLAIEEGANLVRIGSLIFGERASVNSQSLQN
ncbi:MAG: YggS family pyridoxal phosphate-dependent enzyme, partial [Chitinophagales bacterium]